MQTYRKGKNMIAGCIYQYPCTGLTEFDNFYLQKLLDTLAFENKYMFSI